MTINFGGNVYDDAGNAVSGASVKLLETGTTTQEGSTVTTNSDGRWDFSEADQDRYDVEITKGSSVRRIKWSDEISLQEIDIRNNTGAATPAATFSNITDAVANQVAVFSGANATRADGDEIYLSFKLADSAGNIDEFARITAEATDVTSGSEDGQMRFGVIVAGTLTDVFTINSTTGGATSISYEVDSFTIKGEEGGAGVLYLMADQGDDAGDEWKVNVADSGVLTFGNDIASAGSYVTHLTVTPNSTIASSSMTLPGILDVNGSVDWDVTDVQVDSSGDIDLVSTSNAAAAIYLQENGGTSGTIKIHADQGTSVTEGAESINILSDAGGVGIRSTANLANAVNITVDGGTTSSMTLFNDQGTGATEGSASIQLLSDAGGINIKSGLNGANAILLTADAGTSETIVIHADQGTGTGSIELLSDAGGVEIDAGTDIILDAGGADIFLKDDGTLFGTLTNSSGELVIKSSSSGTTAATFSGANVTLAGTVGSGAITSSGVLKTDDATEATSTTDGSLQTDGGLSVVKDAVFGDDIFLLSDSAVLNMGAGNDFTITHDGTTGATIAGNPLTLDSGGDITLDAEGADIFLKDGGTLFGTLTNSSGELVIKSSSSGTTAATFSGANVTLAGTIGSGAITSTGIVKTDDTTNATSTTDGSLQTDGGLSVVLDAVFGDDVFLLSDSAVFNMGAGNDFTITHDGTTGATIAGNPITITSAGAATWSTSSGALTISTGSGDLTLDPTTNTILEKAAVLKYSELTLSSGVITVTSNYHTIDTEGNASTDDLDTISGAAVGQFLILQPASSGRDVTIKNGGGNIYTRDGADVVMTSTSTPLLLLFDNASVWRVVGGQAGL
jgi:hypothetical protein